MKLKLGIKNLNFAVSQDHCNKMTWEGVVTQIDTPSDGAPGGSGGLRTIFDRAAVELKYQTLQHMGLNVEWPEDYWSSTEDALTGHDIRFKIGFVTESWIEGNNLMAKGVIWKQDFYDICTMIINGKDALGFSVEAMIDQYEETTDGFLKIKDLTFTGVALLWKNSAAFEQTQLLKLVAQKIRKDDVKMTPEELQSIVDAVFGKVSTALDTIETKIEEKLTAVKAELKDEVSAAITAATPALIVEPEPAAPVVTAATDPAPVVDPVPAAPQRRSIQYNTQKKFETNTDKMSEISAKKELTPVQRMAEKLKLFSEELTAE